MSLARRVVVLGASYSGGQRAITHALATYLSAQWRGKADVRVLDFLEHFAPGLDVLARLGYERSGHFLPWITGDLSDLVRAHPEDTAVRHLESQAVRAADDFMDSFIPDAVISTCSFAGGVASELKSSHGYVSATLVTDLAPRQVWLHPATDLYFVACGESREDLVVAGVVWDRIVVSGIPVTTGHENGGATAHSFRKPETSDRFSVAVYASPGMAALFELVTAFAAAGMRVFVISGEDDRLKRRLTAPGVSRDLITVFDLSDDTGTIPMSANVFVARPGCQGMYAAMASGTPVVLYPPVPGHEVRNVDQAVNYGAALLARDEEDAFEKVRFLFSHPGRIAQMSANMAMIGSASAARVVCERVLAAVERRRT